MEEKQHSKNSNQSEFCFGRDAELAKENSAGRTKSATNFSENSNYGSFDRQTLQERCYEALDFTPCKFSALGCSYKGTGYEIEAHEADAQLHLDLVLRVLLLQKREIADLREKTTIVNTALTFCETYITTMDKTLKSVDDKTKAMVPQLGKLQVDLQALTAFVEHKCGEIQGEVSAEALAEHLDESKFSDKAEGTSKADFEELKSINGGPMDKPKEACIINFNFLTNDLSMEKEKQSAEFIPVGEDK